MIILKNVKSLGELKDVLETKTPREQSGRDSFSRYRAQVRSAALAALSILEGKSIDRVYCDLHDDFVVRERKINNHTYLFYQVKTHGKQNHNWTIGDLLNINSRVKDFSKHKSEDIRDSFIGKLLLHTVVFDEYCNCVIFQTNLNNHDDVDNILNDISSGAFDNKYSQLLIDRFNDCFSKTYSKNEIKEKLKKLKFQTDIQHLKEKDNGFESKARDLVYQFSEIDLSRTELKEILLKLLDLVERKSSGIIKDFDLINIEKLAGIKIDDLLSILSISQDAYATLLEGGDKNAIKSASIIQRILTSSGGGQQEVEYCSRCKTDWDLWQRTNRHILSEFDYNAINQKIRTVFLNIKGSNTSIELAALRNPVVDTLAQLDNLGIKYNLTENLILGGLISELVRELS